MAVQATSVDAVFGGERLRERVRRLLVGTAPTDARRTLIDDLDRLSVDGQRQDRLASWGSVWLLLASAWGVVSLVIPTVVFLGSGFSSVYAQPVTDRVEPWWIFERVAAWSALDDDGRWDVLGLGAIVLILVATGMALLRRRGWQWIVRVVVLVKALTFVSVIGAVIAYRSLGAEWVVRRTVAALLVEGGFLAFLVRADREAHVPVYGLRRRLPARLGRSVLRVLGVSTVSVTTAGLTALAGGVVGVLAWVLLAGPAYWAARRSSRAVFAWRRQGSPEMREVLARDARPPILYLRSFDADRENQEVVSTRTDWLVTWEESLFRSFARFGPVVAIGRPGEAVPGLGAARLYVPDDTWRTAVSRLMGASQAVVLRPGYSSGLAWELREAVTTQPLSKLVIVDIDADWRASFWRGSLGWDARWSTSPEFVAPLQARLATPLPGAFEGSNLVSFEHGPSGWVPVLTPITETRRDLWFWPRRVEVDRSAMRALMRRVWACARTGSGEHPAAGS